MALYCMIVIVVVILTVFNVGLFSFLYVSFCGLSGATPNTQQDGMVSIIPQ